ncbi:MAG: alpha/beta hydrolase [Candidatus Lokiarchaeota archaeon]|nr:alpha/beta hydrolase [Candidatus Harpocratesius repetitus]
MRVELNSSSLQRNNNYRLHGKSPYSVIVLHGGPGAWGEMESVASYIAQFRGCIETFQTQPTLKGQLAELFEIINKTAQTPVVLVGFSWGAWLA